MNKIILKPQPLTAAAFQPFGDVIDASTAKKNIPINYGTATRYHDLATVDVSENGGRTLISLVKSTPLTERPIPIKMMERHPLSSQAFIPLSGRPFLAVVGPPGDFDPAKIQAFYVRADQGVNYKRGTWHHYLLSLEAESDFLVVDRGGPEKNCDEVFPPDGSIVLEI